ncbi:hypothetical protein QQP08_009969 [Theobroma cacao]|nr:hypothetical protein QQP08_009969 [Theobroma cacao]
MDSPSSMTCVLKVDTHSRDCHKPLIDILKGLQELGNLSSLLLVLYSSDVSYSIDAQQGLVYISGKVEPHKILRMLGNAGKHVRLSHLQYGNQTPGRLENCCNNLSPRYSPYRNINYGYFRCERIDGYTDDYECGYFPNGRSDGYRFDSDYQHYQHGNPLSRNHHLSHRCHHYYEPMEQHAPLPIFDTSEYDLNAGKVKGSCCHIM